MAHGVRPGALLRDRLDLRAGSDASNRGGDDPMLDPLSERQRGVALGAPMAEDDERVTGLRRGSPQDAVRSRERNGVRPRKPQKICALIRSVNAGPGADEEKPPSTHPLGNGVDWSRVRDQPRQLAWLSG